MRKSRPRQLHFAFAESPQGNGGDRSADASAPKSLPVHPAESSQRLESAPPPVVDPRRLLELVAAQDNLRSALAKVVRNRGAPGADKQTVREVVRHAGHLLPKLSHALLTESYVPGDVRRVWIPKPNGGQRGLGIPNVVDRWVQQAVLQILEPIYEPTFHASSHGFHGHPLRPG